MYTTKVCIQFHRIKIEKCYAGMRLRALTRRKGFLGFARLTSKETYPLYQPENVCFLNIVFSPFLLRELLFFYPSFICFVFALGGRRGLGQVDRVTFRYW